MVDNKGMLTGLIFSDQLLELLISDKEEDRKRLVKDIAQPAQKIISINTTMIEVMQIMDRQDLRILPVTNENGKYMGFVAKNTIFSKYRNILMRAGEFM